MKVKASLAAQVIIFSILFFLNIPVQTAAQDSKLNKYGLHIIKNSRVLKMAIKENPAKEMIDLKSMIPGVVLDLRYASANNFMQKKLYPSLQTTFLRLPATLALQKIQEQLMLEGLGLKIFDAYRPYHITEKMWNKIKDERYVADPKKGSGHNRGTAVDLTIIKLQTKEELDMGTDFDNFSDTAHHNFMNLSKEILQHRALLKSIMERNGFKAFDDEWWHYTLPDSNEFELLDVTFKQLIKMEDHRLD